MSAQTILFVLLGIVAFDFIYSKVLEYLNIKSMKEELPSEVQDIYDEEKYKKSIAYARTNNTFGLWTSTFSFLLSIILLATGLFGWFDGQDGELVTTYNRNAGPPGTSANDDIGFRCPERAIDGDVADGYLIFIGRFMFFAVK